jgi:hypothetical protein
MAKRKVGSQTTNLTLALIYLHLGGVPQYSEKARNEGYNFASDLTLIKGSHKL